jgi:rhodanese-related sulfurtransferase
MTPFPLPLGELLGQWGAYGVYLLIGFAFGFVLEIAGFGNANKLAAQFYFKDLTVLKVMFSAIVVAMVLIFLATGVGLLDYNLIWVNPTYLWPGIVGGLIMGVGFIVGGFCPGTSLVSAATLKIDGIFFALGTLFGIFLFGESVGYFADFWNSSYMGRFTLMELFNLETGVVVLLVMLMALFMFWGGEQLERIFGGKDPAQAPRWRYAAGGALVALAVGTILIGQPTNAARWAAIAPTQEARLSERAVQIDPGELLDAMNNRQIKLVLLDVRPEAEYNLFHIRDAIHAPLASLTDRLDQLHREPANALFVTVSNDEAAATEAWKFLVAESLPNVYILAGGVNGWLTTFADGDFLSGAAHPTPQPDGLAYLFPAALGARHPAANPDPHRFHLEYIPKIEMDLKRGPSGGGCG